MTALKKQANALEYEKVTKIIEKFESHFVLEAIAGSQKIY